MLTVLDHTNVRGITVNSDDILENEPDQGQHFIGEIFAKDGSWYIDRWMRSDGPFETKEMAEAHKARLTEAYERLERKSHEEALVRWNNRKAEIDE